MGGGAASEDWRSQYCIIIFLLVFLFYSTHMQGCLIFIILFISNGLEVANFVALLISSCRSRGIIRCVRVYDSSLYKEANQVPLSQFL